MKVGLLLLAACTATALLAALALAGDGDIYLEQKESVTLEAPHLEIQRPDKTWTFIDVAAQRALAARDRPAGEVDAEFANLAARIWNGGARALVSVYVERPTPLPTLAALEANQRALVSGRKGEIVEAGRVALAPGVEGVKIDYVCVVERPPAVGNRPVPGQELSNRYYYSRVDVPLEKAGTTVSLCFECPKEKLGKAKAGWVKLLKKLKLG